MPVDFMHNGLSEFAELYNALKMKFRDGFRDNSRSKQSMARGR